MNQKLLSFLLIAAISSLVYINALDSPFQYDDQHVIEENIHLRSVRGIWEIFTHPDYYVEITDPGTGHYRPLLFITFLLNYLIGGLDVVGYHLVNLAFHIGSAFILFLIVQAMFTPTLPRQGGGKQEGGSSPTTYYLLPTTYIPLASALIFAVHPFNSEVVNYITARSSVMSGFFYLLAFYCWVKYREQKSPPPFPPPRGGRVGEGVCFYIASLLAFLLGMLTKEVVITLPIVLWLYDLYFNRPPHLLPTTYYLLSPTYYLLNSRTYIPYIPFVLLVAIPYIVLRMSFTGAMLPAFKRDLLVQLFTEMPVLAKYIRLFFIPFGLNADHYVTLYDWPSLPVIVSGLFLLLFTGVAVWLYRSQRVEWRLVSFFMIWYFIVLLPTTVIPLNAVLQENRGYLAGAGLAVLMGTLPGCIGKAKRISIPLMARFAIISLILFTLGFITLHRNSLWGDKIALWSDAVSKSPLSARARVNLGIGYAAKGQYRKGEREFLKALKLAPDNPPPSEIHLNLGGLYHKAGRLEEAMKEYQAASAIRPEDSRPHYGLGVYYQQKGERDSALTEYKKVMELSPDNFRAYHNTGLLYNNSGDLEAAEGYYKRALSLNPDYASSSFNLGNIYEVSGRIDIAIKEYLHVIRIDPGYADVYYRLAELYKKVGDKEKAGEFHRKVQEIEGNKNR